MSTSLKQASQLDIQKGSVLGRQNRASKSSNGKPVPKSSVSTASSIQLAMASEKERPVKVLWSLQDDPTRSLLKEQTFHILQSPLTRRVRRIYMDRPLALLVLPQPNRLGGWGWKRPALVYQLLLAPQMRRGSSRGTMECGAEDLGRIVKVWQDEEQMRGKMRAWVELAEEGEERRASVAGAGQQASR